MTLPIGSMYGIFGGTARRASHGSLARHYANNIKMDALLVEIYSSGLQVADFCPPLWDVTLSRATTTLGHRRWSGRSAYTMEDLAMGPDAKHKGPFELGWLPPPRETMMGCRECPKHVEHLHPDALWRVDMDYARAAYLQLGSSYGKFRYHGSYRSRTIQQAIFQWIQTVPDASRSSWMMRADPDLHGSSAILPVVFLLP